MNGTVARRRVGRGLLVVLLGTILPASAGELDDFFNDVGAYGNVTGSAAYRGQAMNYYTPGSLFMRVPNKTYQLASFTPPSVRAGCGGISLYGGAFSYINKDAFINMLRNIGQNTMGVAFDMALKTLCPVCSDVMNGMETIARHINSLNINSCQAATKLVNATADGLQAIRSYVATNWAREGGIASDENEARLQTQGDDGATADVVANAMANDPSACSRMPCGNLVWRALKKIPMQRGSQALDDLQRQVIMSLTGTVIYRGMGTVNPRPDVRGATLTSVEDFIGKPDLTGPADNTSMVVFMCDTLAADGCLNPTPVSMAVLEEAMCGASCKSYSLAKQVSDALLRILSKIQNNQPQDAQDLAFIGVAPVPVYKMLSVAATVPGLAETMIYTNRDVLAAAYAVAYIDSARKAIHTGFEGILKEGTALQKAEVEQLKEQIKNTYDKATQQLAVARRHVTQFNSVADEMLKLERQLFATMPAQLGQSLAYLGVK